MKRPVIEKGYRIILSMMNLKIIILICFERIKGGGLLKSRKNYRKACK